MEIRQLIRDVRRNLLVALAAFVLCVVAGGAAAFLPAKHYTATTLVAVQPAPNRGLGRQRRGEAIIAHRAPQLPAEATAPRNLARARANVPAALPLHRGHRSTPRSTPAPSSSRSRPRAPTRWPRRTSPTPWPTRAHLHPAAQPAESGYQLNQLSPATPPTSPSNPRTPILLGAAAFGVILGIFAAMWAAGHPAPAQPGHRGQGADRRHRAGRDPTRGRCRGCGPPTCSSSTASPWPWRRSRSCAATCSSASPPAPRP